MVFCVAQVFCLQTVFLLPVPRLLILKDMVRRLQELRHTEQVQRAYALNCGEGATVSYEIQIRVLREFGLADAAAELLQVGSSTKLFKIGSRGYYSGGIVDIPEALTACIFFLIRALVHCPSVLGNLESWRGSVDTAQPPGWELGLCPGSAADQSRNLEQLLNHSEHQFPYVSDGLL